MRRLLLFVVAFLAVMIYASLSVEPPPGAEASFTRPTVVPRHTVVARHTIDVRPDLLTLTPTLTPLVTPTPSPTRTKTPTPSNTATAVFTATTVFTATPTFTPTTNANVLTVCASGCNSTTIQGALNAASAGYTVSVKTGTYHEILTIRANQLTLKAFGDGAVWVHGDCAVGNSAVITVDADDVTIQSIGVQHAYSAGIAVANTVTRQRLTVDSSTIQDWNCDQLANVDQLNAAIQAWYGGAGYRITNNTLIQRVDLGGSQAGNGNGVWFKSDTARPSGGGHYIANNFIRGGFDGIGGETEDDPRGSFDRNFTIERNDIAFCADDGIQVEGGGLNGFVQDNTISECGIGIAFATPLTGPLTVQRNAITSFTVGTNGAMICFKAGHAPPAGTVVLINVIQNKCLVDSPTEYPAGLGPGKGIEETNNDGAIARFNVQNNDWRVSSYIFEFANVDPLSTFDFDCMVTSDYGNRFIKWRGTNYPTIAQFRTAAPGQETSGQNANCVGDGSAPTMPTRAPTPTVLTPTPTFTGTPFTPTPAVPPTQKPTSTTVSGTTRTVCASGCTSTTINGAILVANAGDTISVHTGTYAETVTLNKNSLLLKAFGDGAVWITGSCTRTYGIDVEGDDVAIRGIGVKNTVSSGIIVTNAHSRANIDQNTVQDWNCTDTQTHLGLWTGLTPTPIGNQLDAGISAYYAGSGQRVTNNTLTRRVEVAGGPYGQGDAIYFKSNAANASGGGHYIASNTIAGGFDGIGGEDEADARGSFDRDTTIENNSISNCWDDGIQNEGGGQNIFIQDNTISQCGIGVAFAVPKTGPLYVQRNTIILNQPGYYGETSCFKVGNPSSAVVNLRENNCAADRPPRTPGTNQGKGLEETNDGLPIIISYGNKYQTSSYGMELKSGVPTGSYFDFDCFDSLGGANGGQIKYLNIVYNSLSAFKTAVPAKEVFGSSGSGACAFSPTNTPTITPTPAPTNTTGPSPTPTITQTPTQTRTPTATATPGGTTFSLVHQNTTNSTAAAPAAAYTITSTGAGSLLVACIGNADGRTVSSVVTSGLTWTAVENQAASGVGAAMYYSYDAAGGHTSVTVTMSGSTTPHFDVGEFSGSATSAILGNHGFAGPTTSSSPSVTWSPAQTGNLLIGCGAGAGARSWGAGSGYTKLSTDSGSRVGASEYRLSNPGGAETSPMGLDASTSWVEVVGEFKVVTNGGGPQMDFLAGVRQFLEALFS